MRPKAWWAEFAAFGFGKVREKGANAGVERHYAITAWGLNVALRRVRYDQPIAGRAPSPAGILHAPPEWPQPSGSGPSMV